MGIITLTDRISVSVRAKNETESNSQKRATGRNIANALGNGNISDSLADQLGNTSKPTITDENGNEWVSMQDIIDAGKKMQQNGAFATEEVHEGIGGVNLSGNPTKISYGDLVLIQYIKSDGKLGWEDDYYVLPEQFPADGEIFIFNFEKNPGDISKYFVVVGTTTATSLGYYLYRNSDSGQIRTNSLMNNYLILQNNKRAFYATGDGTIFKDYPILYALPNKNNVMDAFKAWYDGPSHKTGGSIIDWNAPNAEIERQIKELHETWDVSEHEGAVTANGTYVLAGPIEYNDADPGSHSSGDF